MASARLWCFWYQFAIAVCCVLVSSGSAPAQSAHDICYKGDGDKGIAACDQAIRLNPNDAYSYYNRGNAWLRKGDYDKAIADYGEAIRLVPGKDASYYNRGNAWLRKGDYDKAIVDYNEAIRLSPKVALYFGNRASSWSHKGDADKAIADYSEAIRLDPKNVQSINNRGAEWFVKGDYDRAIADFSRVNKLDPKNAQVLYNSGLAWSKKNDLQRALADFRRSTELDPSFLAAQRAVEQTSAALNNLRQNGQQPETRFEPWERAGFVPGNWQKTGKGARGDQQQIPKIGIAQGRRLALVIGNNSYKNVPPLEKAVGDADAVSRALRTIGFTVTQGSDLTFEQTAKLLTEFEQSISESDIVFFHFSGHGVQIKGDNTLLPIDTPEPKDGQQGLVHKFGLSAETLVESFNERGASLVVAVLDACRDNPFAAAGTRGIGGSRGLAALKPVQGTFVIYSAGVNQTALDRLGDEDKSTTSVFTRVFLPLLQEPNLSLVDIAKRAQVKVRDLARTVDHEQTPAYYDQVVGNIGLVQR